MNISRKDFFKKSLMSLGEAVFSVKDALQVQDAAPAEVRDAADFAAAPREDQVAVAYNDHCLAKNSGCFACMERCNSGAIKLIPGVGLRINQQLCTGCGTCEYACPVSPKAVRMQARPAKQTPSANTRELPPQKGESPC